MDSSRIVGKKQQVSGLQVKKQLTKQSDKKVPSSSCSSPLIILNGHHQTSSGQLKIKMTIYFQGTFSELTHWCSFTQELLGSV